MSISTCSREFSIIKNAGSVKYSDVCGGTDADNNNVAQYKGNSTVSQDFKLEQSSTGNGYILRSQVGGKTRVLDICKTNGRVENGNNVQIYTNVDPIAQEWLIIPVSQFHYKRFTEVGRCLGITERSKFHGKSKENHACCFPRAGRSRSGVVHLVA